MKNFFNSKDKHPHLMAWTRMLRDIHGDEVASIIVMYSIAAVHKSNLQPMVDQFPVIHLFGPPKSRKSSISRSIHSILNGMNYDCKITVSNSSPTYDYWIPDAKSSSVIFECLGVFERLDIVLDRFYNHISTTEQHAIITESEDGPYGLDLLVSKSIIIECFSIVNDDRSSELREFEETHASKILEEIEQFEDRVLKFFEMQFETCLKYHISNLMQMDFNEYKLNPTNFSTIYNYSILFAVYKSCLGSGYQGVVPFTRIQNVLAGYIFNQMEVHDNTKSIS